MQEPEEAEKTASFSFTDTLLPEIFSVIFQEMFIIFLTRRADRYTISFRVHWSAFYILFIYLWIPGLGGPTTIQYNI